MTTITDADKSRAEEWKWVLYSREDYDPEKEMCENVAELAEDFARHREQEVAKIVAWLRKRGDCWSTDDEIAAIIEAGEYRNDA